MHSVRMYVKKHWKTALNCKLDLAQMIDIRKLAYVN